MSKKEKSEKEIFIKLKRDKLVFDKILEISEDGFLIVDEEGNIININNAYCNYLGMKKEDILGKFVREIIKNSKLPEILINKRTEVSVLHKLAEGQSPTKEKYVVVSRACVEDENKAIAAVGQVKFTGHTMKLANELKEMDDELQYYKKELKRISGNKYSFNNMVGKSDKFLRVKKIAEKATKNDFTVLITGETGTGKEVFANAIHYSSRRSDKPLIRVNCAAIPSELLESELFGYIEGAFTGAKRGGKKGKFELANGGTIFLDEIGDMSLNMQAKLLRVLQEKEIEKVGSSRNMPVDVRIIAATNKNLLQEIEKKNFRADLYYRLNVIRLDIPPLRERQDDIAIFIHYFLDELNEKYETNITTAPSVEKVLTRYHWPGNIRELKNVIYNAYNMTENNEITDFNLPLYIYYRRKISQGSAESKNLNILLHEIEKEVILNTLKRNKYNCILAAKDLGIHRSTLYKKINKFKIEINNIDKQQ